MTNCLKAIIFSLVAHCLVAFGLAFWIGHASIVELPLLDLSAVEISFSEEERETPAVPPPVSDTPPPPPVSDTPPPPEPDTPPPPVSDTPPPPVSDTPPPPEPDTPPPPAPKQARVDAPPKPLKSLKPDYPTGSRQRGEEGNVELELAINSRGGVDSVFIVKSSGHPDLDAAAVRAAKKARFSPAKSGRVAVSSTARITITFKLTSR